MLTFTFDMTGDGEQVFTNTETRAFIRASHSGFTVLTYSTGEPITGNQYDTFETVDEAVDFLTRRGFTVEGAA
jgi:hypothetical protein